MKNVFKGGMGHYDAILHGKRSLRPRSRAVQRLAASGFRRGMGVRHALFPVPTLGASPKRGRRLPDAILHGKRSLRPRSRAVQRLAASGFRVRLFSSLGLVVAPPACEPGEHTSKSSFTRLHHLAPGQLPLLAERSPGATGLASSLSGCFSFSVRRCRF
jgi:hypothetical protein